MIRIYCRCRTTQDKYKGMLEIFENLLIWNLPKHPLLEGVCLSDNVFFIRGRIFYILQCFPCGPDIVLKNNGLLLLKK